MRLFRSREQRAAEARAERLYARAEESLAQVMETVSQQLATDLLAREDQGWRRLGTNRNDRDLSPTELATIRTNALALWIIDPTIGQALFLLNSGTFGKGTPKPKCLDRRVQKLVDRLWEDEDNALALFSRDALTLTSTLLALDGERFFTLYTSPADSQVKLSTLEPSEITSVITHPQNRRRPVMYRREYYPQRYNFSTGQWVPSADKVVEHYVDWRYAAYIDSAMEQPEDIDQDVVQLITEAPNLQSAVVYHLKVNTVGLRGIPEVYRAYDWSKAHAGAVSDLSTITAALAAFAWRKKINTKSAAALAAAANMFASPTPGPGGVHVENQTNTLEPIDVGTGSTQNQSVTVRATLLESIRSFGFGEHWYGDASTGNLATATAMELPAIWRIEDRQQVMETLLRDITLFAVDRGAQMADYVALPQKVDTYFDLDFPPAQPANAGETSMLLGALNSASGTLLDPQEAAYQAYVALGTNDIEQVMERQFAEVEQLEDEAPQVPDETLPPEDETQVPQDETVAEAVRPFGVSAAGRKLSEKFADELQSRVIGPWHAKLMRWLRGLEEAPAERALTGALRSAVRPNTTALREVLSKYHLQAANAGGQAAIDKLRSTARAREAGPSGPPPAAAEQIPPEQPKPETFTFNLRDPKLLRALGKRGEAITGEVSANMLQELRDLLAREFYAEGKGPRDVAAQMGDLFPPTYRNRAQTIARTETLFAQATVQNETFERNGVEKKQWLATIDDKTRDDHLDMQGQTVSMGEPFQLPDGSEIDFPGDPGGDAEQVINCRCDYLPVFGEGFSAEDLKQPWLGD